MRDGGSACTAANRFYVHESLEQEYSAGFEGALKALTIGPGIEPDNDLGAMVSVKERDKVLELVGEAYTEGASTRPVSEAPASSSFTAPHIVHPVEHASVLTRNEIVGPVEPIVTFSDTDDAIRVANDTEYGLIPYVFAKENGEGPSVARRTESGQGREGGFAVMHEFPETQYFAVEI